VERAEPRVAAFAALGPHTLYAILRLRAEAFVVEQECVYLDLDGRDTEPSTRHVWIERDDAVVACARVLVEREGSSIGRVVCAPPWRSKGLGATVMRAALDAAAGEFGGPVVLNAQAHLAGWYGRLGFTVCGDEFIEDGIPHVPMVRR
jgi:ElaA protein